MVCKRGASGRQSQAAAAAEPHTGKATLLVWILKTLLCEVSAEEFKPTSSGIKVRLAVGLELSEASQVCQTVKEKAPAVGI